MIDQHDPRWGENIPGNVRVVGIVVSEYGCAQIAQHVDSYGQAGDYYARSTPEAPFRFYAMKEAWPNSPAARVLAVQEVPNE